MKIKMLLVSFMTLLLISGCSENKKACDPIDGKVCLDSELQQFKIEANATLLFSVPNQAYGEAMVALWNEYHPDHVGAVQYVTEPMPNANYFLESPADLIFMQDSEVCKVHEYLLDFSSVLVKEIKDQHDIKLEDTLNKKAMKYLAVQQSGFAFLANKTMLNAMGVSVDDNNNDGMIDAIDSFEKIMILADQLQEQPLTYKDKKIEYLFPFSFNDVWSFYGFLTASGWNGFETLEGSEPGFEKDSFLESLKFIQELGKHHWFYGEATQNNYAWNWERVLSEEIAPLGIVADWMYYKEYAALLGSEFVITKFPTFGDKQLNPLAISEGYVIRKEVKYPSAANELMRLIASERGFQHFINANGNTGEIIVDPSQEKQPDFLNELDAQMAKALYYSSEEPMIALSNNTMKRAWSMFYEIELMPVLKQVFEGLILPEEGQKKIVQMADQWLGENNASIQEKEVKN